MAAAAAAMTACEKAEDRAVTRSTPKFDLGYCLDGEQSAFRMPSIGCVFSNNRGYVLVMTRDGVLEIRAVRNGGLAESVWTSRAPAKKADDSLAAFQSDGNLVVYEGDVAVWNSGLIGQGDYRLSVTDDGNLVIQTADGRLLWTARFAVGYCTHFLETPNQLTGGCLISPSGAYAMVLTSAASVEVAPVLEDKTLGKPIWTTGSVGSTPHGSFLTVQTDGNLVLYDGGKAIWNSQTWGHSGVSRLELTDQGELQLRGPDGGLLWSSKTGRAAEA